MRHDAWAGWARNFADGVGRELLWLDPAKATALVVYCKSGRDRSVGCAAIVACWLRRGRPDNVVFGVFPIFNILFYFLFA